MTYGQVWILCEISSFGPFVRALGRSLDPGSSVYIHAFCYVGPEKPQAFCQCVNSEVVRASISYSYQISLRYAALMYAEEGRGIMDRLWRETMEEFKGISALADKFCVQVG